MMTAGADVPTRLYRPGARALSFAVAAACSAVVLVYPQALAPGGRVPYGWLLLLMWGMAAGFVHGVGYVPAHRVLRLALGPLAAWALLGAAAVWFANEWLPANPPDDAPVRR
jgi:predicted membrane protein